MLPDWMMWQCGMSGWIGWSGCYPIPKLSLGFLIIGGHIRHIITTQHAQWGELVANSSLMIPPRFAAPCWEGCAR